MARTYGDRIAVGVDARDGYVAVNGWKELSRERGVDFCRRLRDGGVGTVSYSATRNEGLDITASGGVSTLEELRRLEAMGVRAAILGKALYDGRLDLRTVVEEVGAC